VQFSPTLLTLQKNDKKQQQEAHSENSLYFLNKKQHYISFVARRKTAFYFTTQSIFL